MKKFLLPVAAMALFAAPSFAQDDMTQDVECEYTAEENGDAFYRSYDCELVQGDGFFFTLDNVFNSGEVLDFSFNPEEVDEAGWAPIEYHESAYVYANADPGGFTDYILRLENGAQWEIQTNSGATVKINRVCFRDGSAWLHLEDNEDGDWYDYKAQFFYWADTADGWADAHYLSFYFDNLGGGSKVASVEVENGVAEFYNLQGQKVANPTKGLYIVREGKTARKVML